MSDDELRKEFQQISTDIQRFDEYGKQLQVKIEALQSYLIDLTRSKTTLVGMKEEKNADETLIPLGSGVMVRAKPLEPENLFYTVGAGVVVTKPIDDIIKDIDIRLEEVDKERAGLADQLGQIINQINSLERRAQIIYRQLQGPAKPQYDPDLVS